MEHTDLGDKVKPVGEVFNVGDCLGEGKEVVVVMVVLVLVKNETKKGEKRRHMINIQCSRRPKRYSAGNGLV